MGHVSMREGRKTTYNANYAKPPASEFICVEKCISGRVNFFFVFKLISYHEKELCKLVKSVNKAQRFLCSCCYSSETHIKFMKLQYTNLFTLYGITGLTKKSTNLYLFA